MNKKYTRLVLFPVATMMLFLATAFILLPSPEKLEDYPDGWMDGRYVCYKGEGCPSWVCRDYGNVCEKFVVITCIKPQYMCKWDNEISQKICSIQPSYYKCSRCTNTSMRCQAACYLK